MAGWGRQGQETTSAQSSSQSWKSSTSPAGIMGSRGMLPVVWFGVWFLKGFWGSNSDPLYQLTPQPLVFYNPYFGTFEFSLPNICYFREKIKDGGHNLSVGCLPSKHNALHWIRSTQNTQVNSIGPLQKNKMPRSGMKYKMIVSLRTAGSDLGSRLSTDQLPSLICSWQGEFLAWQSLQQSPYEHSANDLSLQVRPSQHGSDSHSCEQKTVPSK